MRHHGGAVAVYGHVYLDGGYNDSVQATKQLQHHESGPEDNLEVKEEQLEDKMKFSGHPTLQDEELDTASRQNILRLNHSSHTQQVRQDPATPGRKKLMVVQSSRNREARKDSLDTPQSKNSKDYNFPDRTTDYDELELVVEPSDLDIETMQEGLHVTENGCSDSLCWSVKVDPSSVVGNPI